MDLTVRNTLRRDIPKIQQLQRIVYPHLRPWSEAQLVNHLKVFPEGQFVAELHGEIVGASSSLIVLWEEYDPSHSFMEITGMGTFDTHNPKGKTLYGAEVCVNPNYRRKGIGHKLYEVRRNLCRQKNLRRIIAAGRLPNYYNYADKLSPREYVMHVLWGDIYDPVLRFQIDEGFHFCDIVDSYLPGDEQSKSFASLIVWLNKDYNPAETERK